MPRRTVRDWKLDGDRYTIGPARFGIAEMIPTRKAPTKVGAFCACYNGVVGAVIDRLAGKWYELAGGSGENVTSYCRATNGRPYDF